MPGRLTVSPSTAYAGSTVDVIGSKFGPYPARLLLDGVEILEFVPAAGSFSKTLSVGTQVGTRFVSVTQYRGTRWRTAASSSFEVNVPVGSVAASPVPGTLTVSKRTPSVVAAGSVSAIPITAEIAVTMSSPTATAGARKTVSPRVAALTLMRGIPTIPGRVTSSLTMLGPGVAADGKDNRPVGRSDDSHYAARWTSKGGTATSVAFNQRFGPNQTNAGTGYSHGTGGLQRISLQRAVNGVPDGVVLASRQYQPTNPGTNAEDRSLIPFSATVPAGDVCLVWDNIDPDPTNNWFSQNCLYNPQGTAQPGTTAVVLERADFTGDAWRVVSGNTPTFQVTFADGRTEGQGYGSIIANTNLDGSGQYSGFELSGVRKVRQTLVAPSSLSVSAAWLRVKRLSGTGVLQATIGATSATADVGSIPATAKADLNGGKWVRVALAATVSGTFTVTYSTTAVLDVMPIRKDGYEQDGWAIPDIGGYSEKSLDGSSWSQLYSTGTDLQMYLEVA